MSSGFVSRLLGWLRGPETTPSPGDLVELCVVPTFEGPMTVAALLREGIAADGFEVYDVATKRRPRFVVRVPFESVESARAVLDSLH